LFNSSANVGPRCNMVREHGSHAGVAAVYRFERSADARPIEHGCSYSGSARGYCGDPLAAFEYSRQQRATLIARVGADRTSSGAGSTPASRFNQPSGVALFPGVPDSMLSCPSKCERVGSGDPAAWTKAKLPCAQSGIRGVSEGCKPNCPSRSMAPLALPGLSIAIVERRDAPADRGAVEPEP
jgi:hypothetical protein